jgi:hypothetical protein
MTTTNTPSAASQQAASPLTARDLLDAFINDLFLFHYMWASFKYLFTSEKTRIDVLNATAPGAFWIMQRAMFDDVVMRINRLIDDATVGGQPTASLAQFLKLTGWQSSNKADRKTWARFDEELKKVRTACAPCRDYRNEYVSHRSLGSLQARRVSPPTIKMVDDAIAAIEQFVTMAEPEFGRVPTHFTPLNVEGDVERLMRSLLNREAQKKPEAVSTMRYFSRESRQAFFDCIFCGETTPGIVYLDGTPSPRRLARRHFASCQGVVGIETLHFTAVDVDRECADRALTVDLMIAERDTE